MGPSTSKKPSSTLEKYVKAYAATDWVYQENEREREGEREIKREVSCVRDDPTLIHFLPTNMIEDQP